MISNYFRLVPYVSIIWIISFLVFPLLKVQIFLSEYYNFWIWGYPYIPIIQGINFLDILLKILSIWFIIELIFNVQSIFRIHKVEQNFDNLSERWFKWGIINLIILAFCLLWVILIKFITLEPLTMLLDIGFYLIITYSVFLLLSRVLYKKIFLSKNEKKDYTNLVWLRTQVYDLNRSIQEIADEQNTSVITIHNWIKKLDNSNS